MARFFRRHWIGTSALTLVAVWGLVFLPQTPTFAIYQMKRAIDAHDGERAAQFVDFESVVKHAGYELVQERKGANDPVASLIGKSAVDLLYKPIAGAVESSAKQKVTDGAREVQMPAGAIAAAMVLLHRDGDLAWTNFKDHKGQVWKIHMARRDSGQWQIVEVENIGQLLDRMKQREEKNLGFH